MTHTNIRWMIRRDMPTIYRIEEACFEFPWPEEEFIRCLRQRNVIGMVAEAYQSDGGYGRSDIAGYMIYELHKNRLHLLNFAVDPMHRRTGIATAMMDKIKGKLSHERICRHSCSFALKACAPYPCCATTTKTRQRMHT